MPDTIVLATRNAGKVRELAEPLSAFGIELVGLESFDLPEVEESGLSFAANARLKAEAVARATGLTAVADDSGLCVDALGGAPGVRSARYWQDGESLPRMMGGAMVATPDVSALTEAELAAMGQDARNVRKLLHAMQGIATARRTARFCCAMCAVHPPLCGAESDIPEGLFMARASGLLSVKGSQADIETAPLIGIDTEGQWDGLILEAPQGSGGFGYDPIFLDPELKLSAAEMERSVKMARSHRARALTQLLQAWPDFWRKRDGLF